MRERLSISGSQISPDICLCVGPCSLGWCWSWSGSRRWRWRGISWLSVGGLGVTSWLSVGGLGVTSWLGVTSRLRVSSGLSGISRLGSVGWLRISRLGCRHWRDGNDGAHGLLGGARAHWGGWSWAVNLGLDRYSARDLHRLGSSESCVPCELSLEGLLEHVRLLAELLEGVEHLLLEAGLGWAWLGRRHVDALRCLKLDHDTSDVLVAVGSSEATGVALTLSIAFTVAVDISVSVGQSLGLDLGPEALEAGVELLLDDGLGALEINGGHTSDSEKGGKIERGLHRAILL